MIYIALGCFVGLLILFFGIVIKIFKETSWLK
jgi:hypothetical protein